MKISKRLLATVLAILMLCSGLAVSAYATETTDADLATFTVDDEALTVKAVVDGTKFDKQKDTIALVISKKVATSYATDETVKIGETLFDKNDNAVITATGLKAGTEYAAKAVVTKENDDTIIYEETFSILKTRTAPKSVTATAGVGTLKVDTVNGSAIVLKDEVPQVAGVNVEFKLVNKDGKAVDAAGKVITDADKEWITDYSFKGLTQKEKYTVNVRFAKTSEYKASEAAFVVKTILESNTAKPAAPVFTSVTKTSITFKEVANAQYSLDNGKTWKDSPVFSGLPSGATYTAVIKVKATETKAESPVSDSTKIRTNTADIFEAQKADIKVTGIAAGDAVKSGSSLSVSANTVKRTEGTAQWGDTQLVPVSIKIGSTSAAFDAKGKAEIQPSAGDNGKTVDVVVTYSLQKYTGKWENTKTETVTFKVTVVTALTASLGSFISLITNTIPSIFAQIIGILSKLGVTFIGLISQKKS